MDIENPRDLWKKERLYQHVLGSDFHMASLNPLKMLPLLTIIQLIVMVWLHLNKQVKLTKYSFFCNSILIDCSLLLYLLTHFIYMCIRILLLVLLILLMFSLRLDALDDNDNDDNCDEKLGENSECLITLYLFWLTTGCFVRCHLACTK